MQFHDSITNSRLPIPYSEINETLELLSDALNDAQTEGKAEDIQALQIQYNEAQQDLVQLQSERDEVAQRCEKLREQLKAKQEHSRHLT